MHLEKLLALLLLLGEVPLSITKIPNEYCGDHTESSCDICKQRPWWLIELVNTGVIKIGWRKRVIVINWSATQVCLVDNVTDDNVTKDPYMVHAYGYAKALGYLEVLIYKLRCATRDEKRRLAGEE